MTRIRPSIKDLLALPGEPVVGECLKILKSEHCDRPDSHTPFLTSNYKITTTPAQEWKVTTEQDESLADMHHHRRLPNIQELCQSDAATKACLTEVEVISIVLYTGPMVSLAPATMPCPAALPLSPDQSSNQFLTPQTMASARCPSPTTHPAYY
jgi:hypothetical protein